MRPLYKNTVEGMMDAELDDHLGYKKFHTTGKETNNERNGYYNRKLKTEAGAIDLRLDLPGFQKSKLMHTHKVCFYRERFEKLHQIRKNNNSTEIRN